MAKLKKKIDRKEARFGRQYHTPEPHPYVRLWKGCPSRQRQRAGWEHPCCLDPPDRTLKLLDTAASPGTALRWRSPKTTYQLPHKMVNPGWSQGPWKGRMGKTKSLAIWKCRKLFLYEFYKKKNPVFQTQAIVSDPLKVLLFLSWVVMIPASFGLVLPSAGSLVGWLAEMHDSSEVAEQTQREPQLLLHYHHTPARRANQHFWDTQELSFVAENPGNQPLENVQVVVVVVVFLLSGMQDLSSLTRDQTCTLSIKWKLRLLTTGSPEKSQGCSVFTKEFWSRSILFSVIYKTRCLHPEWD